MPEPLKPCPSIYDKHGIPIEVGDVVKVFHFTGARRKKHFMYKQALGITQGAPGRLSFMTFSHLNLSDETYHELADGRMLAGYEIVQGRDIDFTERPRRSPSINKGGE